MSIDKTYIWVVKKVYNEQNVIIEEYIVNENETPRFSVYNKNREIVVSKEKIDKLKVYDFGSSSVYISVDGEIMIYAKILKANHDFERFVATIR